MKVIIVGCGRLGAKLADLLDSDGHDVIILDTDAYSFRRLSAEFHGTAIVGDGLDEDVLAKAGTEQAGAFVAVTQGDNRNIMASQIAKHVFHVPRVLCRIYDPLRRDLFSRLGLEALSPTVIFAEMFRDRVVGT
jgi:trk system potassium uptake protein TrkA